MSETVVIIAKWLVLTDVHYREKIIYCTPVWILYSELYNEWF